MQTISWRVTVDGDDMSDVMNPYLQGIEVSDKEGGSTDTARLEFDDSAGQVLLPEQGSYVAIELEGVKVFEGTVDEITSTGARGQGMILTVSCKSADMRGKVKESLNFHKDDATLQEYLEEAGRRAGIASVEVDPAFGAIKREYWNPYGANFVTIGEDLARELGGTFKVRGNTAVLAKRGQGMSPSGEALPTITATRGDNLLSWDVRPFVGRHRYKKTRVHWFDRKEAKHKHEELEIEGDSQDVANIALEPAPDVETARLWAEGMKADSERDSGMGTVRILLDPTAQAEGTLTLKGVRHGVDGTYRISGVTHRVSRSGSETSLEIKQPQGDAGIDDRDGEAA